MDGLYTITQQYHDKNDIYIYVVRLSIKVEKDDFEEIRKLAKNYGGYYSSFRGVNGFVFKTEKDAKCFGTKMKSWLGNDDINEDIQVANDDSSDHFPKVHSQPTIGMPLHQALRYVIDAEGQEIIKEVRLINILDDFKAYESIPASKYILRAIIVEKYCDKLLDLGVWNTQAERLIDKFTSITGFIPQNVNVIFNAIAYGLGWIAELPIIQGQGTSPKNANSGTRTLPKTSTSSVKRRKSWSKLDVEEREEWLNSLVEIKQSTCGLIYDSIYIADDSYDNDVAFYINYEVSGSLPKDKWINLAYAIYDTSNRLREKSILTSTLGDSKGKSYNIVDSDYVSLNFKYYDIGKIMIYIED